MISGEPRRSLSLGVARLTMVRRRGETAWRDGDENARHRERKRERCVADGERQMIGGERKNELNKPNNVWH